MNKLIESHFQEMITREWNFNDLYNFIKKNQFISTYRNGKKYFFFAAAGKIYCMSEFLIAFFIYTITFFGIISLRKIFQKYKIKKKLQKILKKVRRPQGLNVRGGENFHDNILHYEDEIDVIGNETKSPVNPFFKLTFEESFVKGIVKKCLKPNRFYTMPFTQRFN